MYRVIPIALGVLSVLGISGAFAQELPVIHDMHYADLSPDGSQVAFSYQGDLWVADLNEQGQGVARRLTVHMAYDCRIRFSPDGERIAFSSNRYGGDDIFLVPAAGGEIERVTHHSAGDVMAEWSPDGTKLLFNAGGRDFREGAPYEIDLESGYVRPLLHDSEHCSATSYSPCGRYVAGVRGGQSWWRKDYKGSGDSDVFIYDRDTDTMEMLTEDYNGTDNWPVFAEDGKTLCWVSDRDGRPNVYAMDLESREIRRITQNDTDATIYLSVSGDGKTLIYEWNFDLWTVPVSGGEPRKLEIRAPIDHKESFEAEETKTSDVEEMEPNRDGSWVAIRLRDDIFLIKPEFKNGSIRLTDWPGMDGDYYWHPDGKRLVYLTQENGPSDIWMYDTDTKEKRPFVEDGKYYLDMLGYTWDGTKLLFRRDRGADGIYAADAETGQVKKFIDLPGVSEVRISPDGRWIAATINHVRSGTDIYLRAVGRSDEHWVNITNNPDGNSTPMWSPDGKKLFFVSYRTGSWQIHSIDLVRQPVEFDDYEAQFEALEKKDEPAEQPEEKPEEEPAAEAEGEAEGEETGDEAEPEPEPEPERPEWQPAPIDRMTIDFLRIDRRAKRVTTSNTNEGIVGFSGDGKRLVFTRGQQIWTVDLDGSNQRQFVNGDFDLGSVRLTEDGKLIFFTSGGDVYKADAERGGSATKLNFKAELDRDARMLQQWAFRQGWALLDENFYSPTRHDIDWAGELERYLPHVTGTLVIEDFVHLMSRLIGELNASHLGCYGGGRSGKDTARLGIVPDPAYAGPGILVKETLDTGPCDQPDTRGEPGEYIVAIDGEEVSNTERVHELLAGRAGERVKLTVNAEPTLEGAREISIKPFSSGALSGLWYDLWVESNRNRVLELSDNRVYYIHMNAMNATTLAQFTDEIQGPAQRYDAVIIDVRWNSGGYTHDSVIGLLYKKIHGWHAPRNNPLTSTPAPMFGGPMCCLINQHSFSNAEIFPNAFRTTGLGPLVGVPTAGGVIGTWDTTLVNGAGFRVPVEGWYTAEGINLENYGVPPDIHVEYPYEAYREGRDPQLEAAVAAMLEALDRGEGWPTPPDVDDHRMDALP